MDHQKGITRPVYQVTFKEEATALIRTHGLLAIAMLANLSIGCNGADFVYFGASSSENVPDSLTTAAAFYGAGIIAIPLDHRDFRKVTRAALRAPTTVGVVIGASAVGGLNKYSFEDIFNWNANEQKPTLIIGIHKQTPTSLGWLPTMRALDWSCKTLTTSGGRFSFADMPEVNQQLSALTLDLPASFGCALSTTPGSRLRPVISISHRDELLPVLARVGEKLFLATDSAPPLEQRASSRSLESKFAETMVPLIFLRYALGRLAWHVANSYANLTIDDPWLINPYGFLDYWHLSNEMEKHKFHTTIAFIPWNFDRSRRDVVSLLAHNPDKYSIAIHGNNHDHREFGSYSYKSQSQQEIQVMQAIARMDKFRELTGLSYDRVMVFPHGISPAGTLRILKANGFIGTTNAVNVPLNYDGPLTSTSLLRSTALFENFPSTTRYTAEYSFSDFPHDFSIPRDVIGINAFLGNPILLYGHQGMFARDIRAFNATADFVNSIDPGVAWKSLGYILERSFLQRARLDSDNTYDVLTFSSRTCLENKEPYPQTFNVRKLEDNRPAIGRVELAGKPHPFSVVGGHLETTVTVAAGQAVCLNVEYLNNNLSRLDVSRTSARVAFLRMVSDWRDLHLSRTLFGRWIIRVYYGDRTRRNEVLAISVGLIVLLCTALLWYRRSARRTDLVRV